MGKVKDDDLAVAKSKITRPDISLVIPLIMQLFKACKRLVSVAKNNTAFSISSNIPTAQDNRKYIWKTYFWSVVISLNESKLFSSNSRTRTPNGSLTHIPAKPP